MYITLVGFNNYMGIEVAKVGNVFNLIKDKENDYDDEAIEVRNDMDVTVAYVANSTRTVARGTHSAGYIYEQIPNEAKCTIRFIVDGKAIAEVSNENGGDIK